jgi:CheY-like chemotaxis protein
MGTSSGVTVLVSDRNSRVREFMAREFRADGWRVLLAGDGWEMFRILRREPLVDLLVLDPDLPNRYGSDLLGRIREERPEVPILVHSWRTDEPVGVFPVGGGVARAPVVLVVKNGTMDGLRVAALDLLEDVRGREDGA